MIKLQAGTSGAGESETSLSASLFIIHLGLFFSHPTNSGAGWKFMQIMHQKKHFNL